MTCSRVALQKRESLIKAPHVFFRSVFPKLLDAIIIDCVKVSKNRVRNSILATA